MVATTGSPDRPSADGRRRWEIYIGGSATASPARKPGNGSNATSSVCSGSVERKNGWQMAEAIGERDPQGVQRLLNAAKWDADEVRDDLREYVVEHLADEATGVLIVDETGFLKKGEKSVGVARQYTGTAGDTVNCQVGVFLAYSSEKGAAFLDRALYLPRAWTNDPARRAEAGVPEELVFRNKVELAEGMLRRAFEAEVPARWVRRGFVLRPLARLPGVARGARQALRRDGARRPTPSP